MDLNEQLYFAISTAVDSHYGQLDKGGKPYILHCLHLMSKFLHDPELAAVAVLHDVIEDTKVTAHDLEMAGFNDRVTVALSALSRGSQQSYEEYIGRVSLNADAVEVKLKDLEHNSNVMRLDTIGAKDLSRVMKYHKAFVYLSKVKQGERK